MLWLLDDFFKRAEFRGTFTKLFVLNMFKSNLVKNPVIHICSRNNMVTVILFIYALETIWPL